jgi:Major Facilitator Superfamily
VTGRVAAAWRSGPLAVRSFRLLAGGQLTSTIGDYCYAVALPWLVLSSHGGVILLGTVLACYGVTRTVLIPVGGVLADKVGPRTVMLLADAVRCVLVAVLALLAARHDTSLAALGPIAALIGAGEGLFLPASYAIMPSLLDGERLGAGNAISTAAVQAGSLLGPALGGALVAATGSSTGAFAIDAASFAVSALTLGLIPRRPASGSAAAIGTSETIGIGEAAGEGEGEGEGGGTARDEDRADGAGAGDRTARNGDAGNGGGAARDRDGVAGGGGRDRAVRDGVAGGGGDGVLALLRRSRALQVILVVAVAANLTSGGMGDVALPALAHARFGAAGYGALLACLAAGGVIGTLGATRTGKLRAPAIFAVAVFLVFAVAIGLVPYIGEAGAAAVLLVAGACNGLGNVTLLTVLQKTVPSSLLGRMMGAVMLCAFGSFPLSVAVSGVLVRHLGPTPFFPIAGGVVALAMLWGVSQREFRMFGTTSGAGTGNEAETSAQPAEPSRETVA